MMRYAMSNMDDQTFPHEKVTLAIEVTAPYAEALMVLDAAREAIRETEEAKQREVNNQIRAALGLPPK
ncbi:hypothetical protein SEA_LOSER_47 [Mycobacterium phage Loser]|uniref:hypothetical protein n=1 Tax=Mycobacterium phage Loser TaxID=1815969 RepID=UPI00078B2656|nr:hypothetical protein SEA_LOSER_47 [Mycobacterium phage Loser]AMS00943.1 hypothetical protein SEA_LOSER_47 [Mycobacterium phage Loser]